MASRFQAVTLVDSPSYPNSIAWSDENLIAVASGHLVTILNPALPFGPRGLISIAKSEPYPIGVVKREDLASGCLLPTTLYRDPRSVRSISWSNLGMAPNFGCLLAVCTTEGRVKLYRPPFCDFCAEWIEVSDITERLYDYLASISFEDPDSPPSDISNEPVTDHGYLDDPSDSVSIKEQKRKRTSTFGVRSFGSETSCDQISSGSEFEGDGPPKSRCTKSEGRKSSNQIVPAIETRGRRSKKIPEVCSLPLITANQYASRSAMLSSLVVAWSPLLKLSFEICGASENNSSKCFSLLAVGSKSGKISLWRINAPQYYSIELSMAPTTVELIGILKAHSSWVTTISWALLASESSCPQVLLAAGSSDGSVRIWVGYSEEFMKSTEVNNAPFYPLKEIINDVPVSVLSLMPTQPLHKMLLAVGRTSGAFEVWIGDTSMKRLLDLLGVLMEVPCTAAASWSLHGCSLSEVPIPSSSPGMRSLSDIPDLFISCLGLVVSPSNLAVAMVRTFDVNQLDQMYEARLQKAAIEFFWIGGQQKDILSNTSLEFDIESFPGFAEKELVYWESNILWSLKRYKHCDKPLVIWDIVAALLAFKLSAPSFVDHVLVKWLSISFVDVHVENSIGKVLQHVCKNLCKASSRQLHLLNIICRRVVLSELKADEINNDLLNLGVDDANFSQDKLLNLWMELLSSSERELRERLVGFSISAYKSLASSSSTSEPGYWYPLGIAQMEQWVAINNRRVHKQAKAAATKIITYKRSRRRKIEEKEQCSYCSAPVPFDSPEFALCTGLKSNGQKHKLCRFALLLLHYGSASVVIDGFLILHRSRFLRWPNTIL